MVGNCVMSLKGHIRRISLGGGIILRPTSTVLKLLRIHMFSSRSGRGEVNGEDKYIEETGKIYGDT